MNEKLTEEFWFMRDKPNYQLLSLVYLRIIARKIGFEELEIFAASIMDDNGCYLSDEDFEKVEETYINGVDFLNDNMPEW